MLPELFFQQLKMRLGNRLPGSTSHAKMLSPGRSLQPPPIQDNFKESAVLVLLFPDENEISICLIRRPANMKNHAGQIAFPGGKRERHDADLVQTALREAREEIGIDRKMVEVAGILSPVYVQVSDFVITPVVGWMAGKPEIFTDPREVDEVYFVSLKEITDKTNRCEREMETRTGPALVPGYGIDGIFIWGATAMMLAELEDILTAETQL